MTDKLEGHYVNINSTTPINIDHAVIYQTEASPKELLKDIQSLQSKDIKSYQITVIQGNPDIGTTIIYSPFQNTPSVYEPLFYISLFAAVFFFFAFVFLSRKIKNLVQSIEKKEDDK